MEDNREENRIDVKQLSMVEKVKKYLLWIISGFGLLIYIFDKIQSSEQSQQDVIDGKISENGKQQDRLKDQISENGKQQDRIIKKTEEEIKAEEQRHQEEIDKIKSEENIKNPSSENGAKEEAL